MNKENILVFLHGSGYDKTAYSDLVFKLADYFNSEIYTFNAPFVNEKSGFMWFHKFYYENRKDAVIKDYNYSIEYVKNKILNLNKSLENIILLGHSQGGAIAVSVGLELKLKKVITICSDMPYNLKYQNKTNTEIDWYECKLDGYIDKERQKSYLLLKKINANLNFKILDNSSHRDFSNDICNLINLRRI